MRNILIVEDSHFFGSYLRSKIEETGRYQVKIAELYKDAVSIFEREKTDFFIAILDINLPDAPDGQIVDYVLSKGIPVIVVTGDFDDNRRDQLWSKPIVDYILKDRLRNIDYVLSLIDGIHQNASIKVLVVDDSKVSRQKIVGLLSTRRYQVLEAGNGVEALAVLERHPDILLVVTDCVMPKMDGFQLITRLRARYSKEELAIIGISAHGNHLISAKYIKFGASDFITKPFLTEEFYSRVMMHIDFVLNYKKLKTMSTKDPLTGLYNRRYLWELGNKIHAGAFRQQTPLAVAMIDIDDFKIINDRFGHDAGDQVLKKVADILNNIFRCSDIVSRFGGEEFCIIAVNMVKSHVLRVFDLVRKKIDEAEVVIGDRSIGFSVSIGVTHCMADTLDSMIKSADQSLYQAKAAGKNRVALASHLH